MQTSVLAPDTLFFRVFHDSPVGMVITTVAEGRYVEVNAAYARLLGYTVDELSDQSLALMGLEHEEERNMVLDVLRRVGKLGNVPLTLRTRAEEPRTCIASVQVEEIDGQQYLLFIVQDITEHEVAQAALRSSEQRFRLFFQSVPLPLLVIDDAGGVILDVNTAACRTYGYRRDEFLALKWDNLPAESAHPGPPRPGGNGQTPPQSANGQPAANRPAAGQPAAARHRLKDGGIIDVDLLTYSFMLDDRPATLIIVEDVTERRANETNLRHSEERLRIIAEVATDAIWERDMATDEVIWSSGLASMFGYTNSADENDNDWWINHDHPDDRAGINTAVEAAFASDAANWTGEYRFLRADGRYANVLDRAFIIRDDNGRPTRFIGAMVDITEQFHLAEAAAQAALEERQRLARDLHDSVSQSLYSISLMAEAARRRADSGDQAMVPEFINRLGELSQQALRQLRLLVYELRPGVLAQEGLAGALRHRLEAVERRAGLQARLIDESTARVPLPLKGNVFHVAQEALNHSLKFAAARVVLVNLRTTEDEINLQFRDDGTSDDRRGPEAQDSLEMIRRHVAELGGELSLAITADGATLIMCIPMGGQSAADQTWQV